MPLIGFIVLEHIVTYRILGGEGGVVYETAPTATRVKCDYTFDHSDDVGAYTAVFQKHANGAVCVSTAPRSHLLHVAGTAERLVDSFGSTEPPPPLPSALGAISGIETFFRTGLISGEHQRGWRRKDTGGDTGSKHEKSPVQRCT